MLFPLLFVFASADGAAFRDWDDDIHSDGPSAIELFGLIAGGFLTVIILGLLGCCCCYANLSCFPCDSLLMCLGLSYLVNYFGGGGQSQAYPSQPIPHHPLESQPVEGYEQDYPSGYPGQQLYSPIGYYDGGPQPVPL